MVTVSARVEDAGVSPLAGVEREASTKVTVVVATGRTVSASVEDVVDDSVDESVGDVVVVAGSVAVVADDGVAFSVVVVRDSPSEGAASTVTRAALTRRAEATTRRRVVPEICRGRREAMHPGCGPTVNTVFARCEDRVRE
jgi:hypothetical protein